MFDGEQWGEGLAVHVSVARERLQDPAFNHSEDLLERMAFYDVDRFASSQDAAVGAIKHFLTYSALAFMARDLVPTLRGGIDYTLRVRSPETYTDLHASLLSLGNIPENTTEPLAAGLTSALLWDSNFMGRHNQEPTDMAMYIVVWSALHALYRRERGKVRAWQVMNWIKREIKT